MEPNEYIEEREDLMRQVSELKQQLLWYKRTFEERSLLGIICDRVLGKNSGSFSKGRPKLRLGFHRKVKINKAKGSLPTPKKILCTIVNHNHSENASVLYETLIDYFDLVMLDSGSARPPKNSIKFPNIYYSGLLNEAYSAAKKNGYEYLLFICSDVIINAPEAQKLHTRLKDLNYTKVGVYSPASKGGGHFFCKRLSPNELRTVPFVEGFMFLCDLQVLDNICPIDTKENLYGWGLDIAKGFFSKEMGKVCLIDDSVEVEHLEGTGYSRETAEFEMLSWMKSLKKEGLVPFFEEQIASIKRQEGSTLAGN